MTSERGGGRGRMRNEMKLKGMGKEGEHYVGELKGRRGIEKERKWKGKEEKRRG